MFSPELFSKRVRFLRDSHILSQSQLADILHKNKSAINEIEAGRTGATLEAMTNIADLFAVSTDWLLGRIDNPYSVELIFKSESELFDLFKSISLSSNENLIYFKAVIFLHLSADYFKYCSGYTLEQRANVIYALNFWKYAALKLNEDGFNSQEIPLYEALHQIESGSNEDSFTVHVSNFISYLAGKASSKRAGTAFVGLCNQCLSILDEAKIQLPEIQLKITQVQTKSKPSAE